jgi:MSHA biogenesis protein MshO
MQRITSQSAFSLLELIVVVVLLGILATGAGMLIVNPIAAYDATQRRQQLVDQGEMALRQIANDVRRALPNSLRVTPVGSGWALEMVNSVDGARYRDQNQDGVGGSDEVLEFSAADTDFNLLGSFSRLTSFSAGQRIVIYNTSPLNLYPSARDDLNPGIVTPSTASLALGPSATYADEQHIEVNKLTGGFRFTQQSPGQRVFVIDEPTSYICNPAAGYIVRHSNYGFNDPQSTAPGGTATRVATQLLACKMTYSAGTSQRGGILSIEITIGEPGGESVSLLHQVHVENVP